MTLGNDHNGREEGRIIIIQSLSDDQNSNCNYHGGYNPKKKLFSTVYDSP